jgi:hypothetical protein
MIVAALPKYGIADHPYKIRITHNTKVTEVVLEAESFPLYAYDKVI